MHLKSHILRAGTSPVMRFLFTLTVVLHVGGCASSEIDGGTSGCESNDDCPDQQVCNVVFNACEGIRPANNGPGQDMGGNNGVADMNTDDGQNLPDRGIPGEDAAPADLGDHAADAEEDSGTACSPACPSNQVCENGACIDACVPACQAPEVCTANGCALPDCQQVGAICDLNKRDQGQFACLSDESGTGRCMEVCGEASSVSTCPTGEYCVSAGSGSTLNVCISSECSNHSECPNGSCIAFENDFNACFSAGTTLEGQSCNIANNTCETGTYCRRIMSGSNDGICARLCDPWAATPDCPFGQACARFFTTRQGLCTDQLDTATAPYEVCTTVGDACGDAIQCFATTSNQNACFKFCRPDGNDCQGVQPDDTDGACNSYVFAGERSLGLCFTPCDPAASDPCGPGASCVGEICRQTCQPGNEVADCCGGETPCDFTCVNNFCE